MLSIEKIKIKKIATSFDHIKMYYLFFFQNFAYLFGAHTKRQKFKKADYILAISESGMQWHEIPGTVLKFEVVSKQFSEFFIIDRILRKY